MNHLNYKALMNSPMLDRWGIGLEALPGAMKGQYKERRNQLTADYLKKFHPNEIYNRITQEPITASGGMHPLMEGVGVAGGVGLSRTLSAHYGKEWPWGDSLGYGAAMGAAVGAPIAAARAIPYVKRKSVERKLNTFDPISLEQARQLFARNPELSTPERQAPILNKESAFMDTNKFLEGFEHFIKEAGLDIESAFAVRYCLPMINLDDVHEYAKLEKSAASVGGVMGGIGKGIGWVGDKLGGGVTNTIDAIISGGNKAIHSDAARKFVGMAPKAAPAVNPNAYGVGKALTSPAAKTVGVGLAGGAAAGTYSAARAGLSKPTGEGADLSNLPQPGPGEPAVNDPTAGKINASKGDPNNQGGHLGTYLLAAGLPLSAILGAAYLGNQDKDEE
jgi:hypothetical protein